MPFRSSLLAAACGVGMALIPVVAFGAGPEVPGGAAILFGLLPFAFIAMIRGWRACRRLSLTALALALPTAALYTLTRTGTDRSVGVFLIIVVLLVLVNQKVIFTIEGLILAFARRRLPARRAVEDRWLS